MSQRTAKVSSLIKQTVAAELPRQLAGDAAVLTVTQVDVTPDLRQAIVWIGVLAGNAAEQAASFARAQAVVGDLQAAVARKLETKFTPRLELRPDASGEYADRMSRLIKGVD